MNGDAMETKIFLELHAGMADPAVLQHVTIAIEGRRKLPTSDYTKRTGSQHLTVTCSQN